jgi:hypothetical protein
MTPAKLSMPQPLLVLASLLAFLFVAGSAAAQTYGIGLSGPALGNVASAASGDTTFTIDASTGAVTDVGAGGRVTTGSANGTITISCGNTSSCNSANVKLKIGTVGSPTGRARAITSFSVSAGTATPSNISGTNPLTFQVGAIGQNSSKTVKLGLVVPIKGDDGGSAVGSAASGYYVSAIASPGTPPSSGTNGTVTANVFRSLTLTQNSALTFGRMVRPTSGAGWVDIAASNGARTSSGAFWLTLPSPTRAQYTATGEGGKVLSISVPSSFTMTRVLGGGSVTVTTNNNLATTPTLSSIPGNTGTYSFYVGGRAAISNTTLGGAYSGAYTVTVSYN